MEWYEEKDIPDFMAKYANCQQAKVEHQRASGTLQDFNISTQKWKLVIVDFVIMLPHTHRKHDLIWVIVDRMTKSAHFLPVHTLY